MSELDLEIAQEQGRPAESGESLPSKEHVDELHGRIERFVQAQSEASKTGRRAQIAAMEESGVTADRIFIEIVGEYSRADNVGCGINGTADHEVMAEYLVQAAEKETRPHMQLALSWVADQNSRLADARRMVRDFLVLDQLTDPDNYDPGTSRWETSSFFKSSLDNEIGDRVVTPELKGILRESVTDNQSTIQSWADQQRRVTDIGMGVASYIFPKDMRLSYEYVEGLTGVTAQPWRESLTTADAWTNDAVTALGAEETGSVQMGEAMTNFMTHLTGMEAVLERQHFNVGVGVLRAAQLGELPESVMEIMRQDLASRMPAPDSESNAAPIADTTVSQ